jgi:hypothetical protein
VKVKIEIIRGSDKWHTFLEGVRVEVDGQLVTTGDYGGEPEDNCECRTYAWVKEALSDLAKALGAEVVITERYVEDGAEHYDEAMS